MYLGYRQVGLLLCFAYFVAVLKMAPYGDATDNRLQELGGAQLFLTLVLGLALKAGAAGGESATDSTAIDVLLLGMMAAVLGLTAVRAV